MHDKRMTHFSRISNIWNFNYANSGRQNNMVVISVHALWNKGNAQGRLMRFRSSENHLCAYGTGEQVVQTVGLCLTNGWVSRSNGWTFLSHGWASRSNGCMLLQTGEQVIRTAGRFYRAGDQAVRTDANFFGTDDPGRLNECKFLSNGF